VATHNWTVKLASYVPWTPSQSSQLYKFLAQAETETHKTPPPTENQMIARCLCNQSRYRSSLMTCHSNITMTITIIIMITCIDAPNGQAWNPSSQIVVKTPRYIYDAYLFERIIPNLWAPIIFLFGNPTIPYLLILYLNNLQLHSSIIPCFFNGKDILVSPSTLSFIKF
jgi:hypothetical protein